MDAGLLVAREGELEAIRALLTGGETAGRALVLEGEPGVGKTTLWEHGLAAAREAGFRVLVARASESEAGLPVRRADRPVRRRRQRGAHGRARAAAAGAGRRALPRRPDGPAAGAPGDLPRRALGAAGPGRGRPAAGRRRRRPVAGPGVGGGARVRRPPGGPRTRHVPARPPARAAHGVREGVPRRERRSSSSSGPPAWARPGRSSPPRLGPAPAAPPASPGVRDHDGQPAVRHRGRPDAGRVATSTPWATTCRSPTTSTTCWACGSPTSTRTPAGCCWPSPSTPTSGSRRSGTCSAPTPCEAALDAGVVTVDGERVRAAHPLLAAAAKRQAAEDDAARPPSRGSPRWWPTSSAAPCTWRWPRPRPTRTSRPAWTPRRPGRRRGEPPARPSTWPTHAWRLTPADTSDVDRVLALGRHLHDAGEKQRLTELLGDRVESLPPGAARVTAYTPADRRRGRGQPATSSPCSRRLSPRPATTRRCGGACSPTSRRTRPSSRCATSPRADERAAEAVALSEHGTADDQRVAVTALTWTRALRGRPVAHLVDRYFELSPERAYLARHPQRVAGQRLVWRGEVEQARPMLMAFRDRAPRSGRRRSRWRGCTSASWSCGPVGGARCSRCWTSGAPRTTATCCSGRCTSGAAACSRPAGATSTTPGSGPAGRWGSPRPPASAGTGSRRPGPSAWRPCWPRTGPGRSST